MRPIPFSPTPLARRSRAEANLTYANLRSKARRFVDKYKPVGDVDALYNADTPISTMASFYQRVQCECNSRAA